MEVYLVASTSLDLSDSISKTFGEDGSMKLSSHLWLVAHKKVNNTSELYKKLFERGRSPIPPRVQTIIVPVNGYYGYCNVAVWQWIAARRKA